MIRVSSTFRSEREVIADWLFLHFGKRWTMIVFEELKNPRFKDVHDIEIHFLKAEDETFFHLIADSFPNGRIDITHEIL